MSGSWMPWPCLHHQPGRLYRPRLGRGPGQSYRSSCSKASSFQQLVLLLQGLLLEALQDLQDLLDLLDLLDLPDLPDLLGLGLAWKPSACYHRKL